MSEINLLAFGCVVSFVAAAGGYLYLRDCFAAEQEPEEQKVRPVDFAEERLRDAG